jgi:uncharacterized RDD family membrane protein YckC
MKPRFEPDNQSDADGRLSPTLIDPEAYDASEQTFSASLEQTGSSRSPRFVVEEETSEEPAASVSQSRLQERENFSEETQAVEAVAAAAGDIREAPDTESWRSEVAARLNDYRARRRPREPRYPSLQLKFETEPVGKDTVPDSADFGSSGFNAPRQNAPALEVPASVDEALPPTRFAQHMAVRVPPSAPPRIRLAEPVDYPRALFSTGNEATAKVIDFASYSAAPRPFDELAEPVFDRPRIIEAPAIVPPPPALGGTSIEAVEEPANERRPGFEIPLQAAPMGRRMAAGGIDAVLVVAAIVAFAYIFFRITGEASPPARVAETVFLLAGVFWSAYQYLLLVYAGTTPGLRLARLELQRFDGDPVPRGLRRWRMLASLLSAVSLGLGYAWSLLDEDELCWHDRITRTYMAPRK